MKVGRWLADHGALAITVATGYAYIVGSIAIAEFAKGLGVATGDLGLDVRAHVLLAGINMGIWAAFLALYWGVGVVIGRSRPAIRHIAIRVRVVLNKRLSASGLRRATPSSTAIEEAIGTILIFAETVGAMAFLVLVDGPLFGKDVLSGGHRGQDVDWAPLWIVFGPVGLAALALALLGWWDRVSRQDRRDPDRTAVRADTLERLLAERTETRRTRISNFELRLLCAVAFSITVSTPLIAVSASRQWASSVQAAANGRAEAEGPLGLEMILPARRGEATVTAEGSVITSCVVRVGTRVFVGTDATEVRDADVFRTAHCRVSDRPFEPKA